MMICSRITTASRLSSPPRGWGRRRARPGLGQAPALPLHNHAEGPGRWEGLDPEPLVEPGLGALAPDREELDVAGRRAEVVDPALPAVGERL